MELASGAAHFILSYPRFVLRSLYTCRERKRANDIANEPSEINHLQIYERPESRWGPRDRAHFHAVRLKPSAVFWFARFCPHFPLPHNQWVLRLASRPGLNGSQPNLAADTPPLAKVNGSKTSFYAYLRTPRTFFTVKICSGSVLLQSRRWNTTQGELRSMERRVMNKFIPTGSFYHCAPISVATLRTSRQRKVPCSRIF